MGRFSPTVLPEGLRLGDILDRALQNYVTARGLRRQEAMEDEDRSVRREDRTRRIATERAEDLGRPGVSTLADYLANPQNYDPGDETAAGGPITDESLKRIGNAADRTVPIEFKKPPALPVFMPGGETVQMPTMGGGGIAMPIPTMVPQRAPFMTGPGNVFDPAQARKEGQLAAIMDQQMRSMFKEPQPEKPMTLEDQLRFNEENARRTGVLTQRTRTPGSGVPRLPLGLQALQKMIDDKQQDLNARIRLARRPDPVLGTPAEQAYYELQLQEIDSLQEEIDTMYVERERQVTQMSARVPTFNLRPPGGGPPPPAAGTPAPAPAPAAAPAPAPAPAGRAAPAAATPAPVKAAPDLVVLAKKIKAEHPTWTPEQRTEELRRRAEAGADGGSQ